VVTRTRAQLPGGGRVLFPGHLVVALYGHPATPGLGVLGHQDLTASIARARQVAAPYRKLSKVPVVPAFEIIATVAEASAGPDGDYSYATPVATLRPWIRRATAAGMYVILDLQPGRASLLAQARKLLVLHQFRLSMIRDERALDTSHHDLAILVHMDGQGTPAAKQHTWTAVTRAAPAGVFFGWKDFYVKDHPMLDPRQTIARKPQLSMISYQ
jgi:hypothetical protein